MKKILITVALGFLVLSFPPQVQAAGAKTITGNVIKISGSSVIITNSTAAKYSVELGTATLTRKNGAPMAFNEIIVGDKVQVTGMLYSDNSIGATSLKNLSLYAHNSSFTGKIVSIDPAGQNFVLQSKAHGEQKISTNNFTAYSVNGINSSFKDLGLGMTVTVKGQWDRSPARVLASTAKASFKLIQIYFTGTLSMKGPDFLTVIGNGNVIYGVDVSHISLQSKAGKNVGISQYSIGDTLRVWGKHLSGSVSVVATQVKNSSLK